MKKIGLLIFLATVACVLLTTGCVAVQSATFNLSSAKVPNVKNSGDRYCVIKIEEERLSLNERGQTPPPVEKTQSRLATTCPQWFSSGKDAVPVVVHFQSSQLLNGGNNAEILPLYIEGLVGVASLGLIPYTFDREKMDFATCFSCGNGNTTQSTGYQGTTCIKAGNPLTMNEITFSKASGWKPLKPKDPKPRFDQVEERWLDAFCASVALAAQRLTTEERKALRENNEAWWLDAKLGNKRNRPVAVIKNEAPATPTMPQVRAEHPRILSQEWNAQTRNGQVKYDTAGIGRDVAMAWFRDEYLPEYCQTLGVAVSADAPTSSSPAHIRIEAPEALSDTTFLLRFSISE